MKWIYSLYIILIISCVQIYPVRGQGFLDLFSHRRKNKEKLKSETDSDNTEPDKGIPHLNLFKPLENLGLGLHRHRNESKEKTADNAKVDQPKDSSEEVSIEEIPRGRSLTSSQRKTVAESQCKPDNELKVEERSSSRSNANSSNLRVSPCGQNNEFCAGEDYIAELGLKWSTRVHNGTGIYLRDPNAVGGRRYVLIGIDVPNEKYGFCTTPNNERGYCRHLEHCVQDEFRRNFIRFLEYRCDIPNQNYVGTCCPIDEQRATEMTPTTAKPTEANSRDLPGRIPPFLIPPFLQRTTTTVAPRRRTTKKPRTSNGSSSGRPQSRLNDKCGSAEIKISRIVGGRAADPKAFPWMTALLKISEATDHRAGQYCGGVLISEFHVLTAAHCVDAVETSDLAVRVGEYDFSRRNESTSPEDIRIAEKFQHEHFNRYTYQNDIAILKLERSAYHDTRIQSICLPHPNLSDDSLVNKPGIVTGFGTLWYGGPVSDVLQQINVPIWKQEECQAAYSQPIEDTNLCAGVRAGSRDSCQGDSGGPLQLQLQGRYTVVGIVSWGIRCSEPGYPGVYTRVTRYIKWIKSQMEK